MKVSGAIGADLPVEMSTYVGDCALGRIVPDKTRPRASSTGGGNVDHRAALALLDQARQHSLPGIVDRLHIHVEHTFPLVLCNLGSRLAICQS